MSRRGLLLVVALPACEPFRANATGRWTGSCQNATMVLDLIDINSDLEGELSITDNENGEWSVFSESLWELEGDRTGADVFLEWRKPGEELAMAVFDGMLVGNTLDGDVESQSFVPSCDLKLER